MAFSHQRCIRLATFSSKVYPTRTIFVKVVSVLQPTLCEV